MPLVRQNAMRNSKTQTRTRAGFGYFLVLNALMPSVYSQQPNLWHDTSPHTVRFVTVERNIRLEVLDWGGPGQPIVLLAGGGNTAHVFDDFAPKLAVDFHVYGITRRGFGASQFSAIKNVDRLGKDVFAVLDSLKIEKPVLAGHSIAGAELSLVARISPQRIKALIYLEAAYPYAFSNSQSPTMPEFLGLNGPQSPSPSQSDLRSFGTLQKWDAKTYGFRLPISEFRQTWDSTVDGRPTKPRDFPGYAVLSTIVADSIKHSEITVPCLIIFAVPHIREEWTINNPNPKVRAAAEAYFAKIDSLTDRQTKAIEKAIPAARVIKLRGMHYIFITNESDVLHFLRRFVRQIH